MKTPIPTALLLLSTLISTTTASCAHGTTLSPRVPRSLRRRDETDTSVSIASFGYLGATGPLNWASLSPNNTACSTSTIQSPIDITTTTTTLIAAGALKLNIPALDSAAFENLGSTVEVVMAGTNATTVINGKTFNLLQFHFHSPSEHTINGEHFPLEMHMVHQASDSSLAVIALPFQLSTTATTPLLQAATQNLAAIAAPGTATTTAALDFAPLVEVVEGMDMQYYTGSFTTPPCTAGPVFYVATKQLPLDVDTYNRLKKVMGFNARYHQNAPGEENLLAMSARAVAGLL